MGQELWINDCKVVMGGGAGNCSIDLSKLGCSTYLLSKVGKDLFGKFLLEGFNKYNVNTQFVQVDEKIMTGMSIAVTKKQERSFISFQDKQFHFNFNNVSYNDLKQFSHVHLMGYNKKNSNNYIEFCKRVKELNISISADVGWDSTKKWDSSIKKLFKGG
jgi:sugar/nucleoside kinase (ribokinase family)